jgi:serine/threonine-protein kinase RsbT
MGTPTLHRSDARGLLGPILAVLTRYVSPPTAHSIAKLAQRRVPGGEGPFDKKLACAMLEPIEKQLRLYVEDPKKRVECIVALRALLAVPAAAEAHAPPISRVTLHIRAEEDITRARTAARDLAAQAGFTANGQRRVVTAVSELVRNVAQYAREGHVELEAVSEPPGIEIFAQDDGPGIPNLAEVLKSNYKSKLGMGLGLRGVKRLAQRYEVKTGAGRGTTVTAFLKVL